MRKKILDYKGYEIWDIEHSVERYNERVGLDIKIYTDLLKKAIDYLKSNHLLSIEDKYVFVSSIYEFGIQLNWRRDRKEPQVFKGYTATTFSENEMNNFKGDSVKFLEKTIIYKIIRI